MKKENLRLKDMDAYVSHSKLNINEATKVFEMEGNGVRNNDIPFAYLAMKTIKGLVNKGLDINTLPKIFLNRFSTMSFDDAANLVNIMYFKEDLEMKDIYKAVRTFYNFFNDNINYDNDRLDAIKDYILMDNDMVARLYRTILIIDINMLTFNDDETFFKYLSNADYHILEEHFNNNKYKFDDNFNKNLFKAQLSYIKYYFNEVINNKTK